MAEWAPFEANEHVSGASLRIIAVISTGTRQADCRYRIAFDCCGAQKEVSHRAIRGRIEGLNKGCMKCGRKISGAARRGQKRKLQKPVYFEVYYHGWEPPASVVASTPKWL